VHRHVCLVEVGIGFVADQAVDANDGGEEDDIIEDDEGPGDPEIRNDEVSFTSFNKDGEYNCQIVEHYD